MTKYLLDTHVVLWLMFDIDKLPIKILEEVLLVFGKYQSNIV
jgi:PIN domain nuclease of toxin-antitoxin system